jgi:hypothetical protein
MIPRSSAFQASSLEFAWSRNDVSPAAVTARTFRSAGSPWRREMTLPLSSRFQLTGDLGICRILNGMWQVSGRHGYIDPMPQVFVWASRHGLPLGAARHDRNARTALHRPRARLLAEIAKISHFQALLATHSAQIIGDRWDLTIELKGPGEG